jgi:hypothetical protein
MMTVKHVRIDGNEIVEEVVKTWAKRDNTTDGSPLVVYAEKLGSSETVEFRSPGSLFVMNDSGQTVARYQVGDMMREAFKYPSAPTAEELTAAVEKAQPSALQLGAGARCVGSESY